MQFSYEKLKIFRSDRDEGQFPEYCLRFLWTASRQA
jgi:hypothetical protein